MSDLGTPSRSLLFGNSACFVDTETGAGRTRRELSRPDDEYDNRGEPRLGAVFPFEGTAMNTPLQITFHNIPHSRAIESATHEAAARIEKRHERITSCRVVIDQPHRRHKERNLVQVRIDLKLPGAELVVKQELNGGLAGADLRAAFLEVFDEVQRQLDETVDRRRRFVKTHEGPSHARVARLFPEAGYGFLKTGEGREVFFHQNSVLNRRFRLLRVGAEVSFVEELGEKGAQASTVKMVGRHNHQL